MDVDSKAGCGSTARIPQGVRMNLYLRSAGVTYFLPLTGTKTPHAHAVSLGPVEGVADDGAWHSVDIDLRARLRGLMPEAQRIVIDDLRFADLDDRDYRLAGFGGNLAGARWWLRNFALATPDGAVPLAAAPTPTVKDPPEPGFYEGFESGWARRSPMAARRAPPSVACPPWRRKGGGDCA